MKKLLFVIMILALCACQSDDVCTTDETDNGENNENVENTEDVDDEVPTFTEPTDIAMTRNEKDLVNSGNEFAINLFRQIGKNTVNENVFMSPLSATLALSMTANGAKATTLTEMKSVLGFGDNSLDEMNNAYYKLIKQLHQEDEYVASNVANSIWIDNEFPVLDAFKDVNSTVYEAEIRNLDFSDPASNYIMNKWCEDKTNGRIKDLVKNINPLARLYLINTLYFKGDWAYPFYKEFTQEESFTNADGTTSKVDMMFQEKYFRCFQDDDLKIAEFPFAHDLYNMIILLPEKNNSPDKILHNLSSDKWNDWMTNLDHQLLIVRMPKFKHEYEKDLTGDLAELGMKSAFTSAANFSNISSYEDLCISMVFQKTFIEVNEIGVEAAAATLEMLATSPGPPPVPVEFYMDRPFVYAITQKETGVIMFMGKTEKM